jgi:hypothetical protein
MVSFVTFQSFKFKKQIKISCDKVIEKSDLVNKYIFKWSSLSLSIIRFWTSLFENFWKIKKEFWTSLVE